MYSNDLHNNLEFFADGYTTGNFLEISQRLGSECVFDSDWRTDHEVGTDDIERYFHRKGKILRRFQVFARAEFIKIFYRRHHVGEEALLLQQELNGKIYDAVLTISMNATGQVNRISLKMKELFRMISWNNETVY